MTKNHHSFPRFLYNFLNINTIFLHFSCLVHFCNLYHLYNVDDVIIFFSWKVWISSGMYADFIALVEARHFKGWNIDISKPVWKISRIIFSLFFEGKRTKMMKRSRLALFLWKTTRNVIHKIMSREGTHLVCNKRIPFWCQDAEYDYEFISRQTRYPFWNKLRLIRT